MRGKNSALNRVGQRMPTRAEITLKFLKENNYPPANYTHLENTVSNQEVKPMSQENWSIEQSKWNE